MKIGLSIATVLMLIGCGDSQQTEYKIGGSRYCVPARHLVKRQIIVIGSNRKEEGSFAFRVETNDLHRLVAGTEAVLHLHGVVDLPGKFSMSDYGVEGGHFLTVIREGSTRRLPIQNSSGLVAFADPTDTKRFVVAQSSSLAQGADDRSPDKPVVVASCETKGTTAKRLSTDDLVACSRSVSGAAVSINYTVGLKLEDIAAMLKSDELSLSLLNLWTCK